MELRAVDEHGVTLVEGAPDTPFLSASREVGRLLEACFSAHTKRALLYASNLPPQFFDVSSLDAGEVLQKLRNYRVRLAVVSDRATTASTRFHELLAAERRDRHFDLFETRSAAVAWLAADGNPPDSSEHADRG